MAGVLCDDNHIVAADIPRYVWQNPQAVPPALPLCHAIRRRCQTTNGRNHRGVAGNLIHPFITCLTCRTQADWMLNNDRRLATAPANSPYNLRGRPLNGHQGAHTRGRLCDRCIQIEIEAYWNRRYVGRRKTAQQAASTCKCEKQAAKYLCYRDRRDLYARIQHNTDRLAGQGGWLEHLDYDNLRKRAIYRGANAALLTRRRNANMLSNGCRCGRDVRRPPGVQRFVTPTPAAMCTACSGVMIDPTHPRVIGWNWNKTTGDDEPNMTLGRNTL